MFSGFAIPHPQALPVASWIHVRRDFINAYTSFPKIKHWAMTWISKINELFGINRLRSKAYRANDPHWEHQLELENKIEEMRRRCNKQLASKHLHDEAIKILNRLKKYWHGLTTFIHMPEIPMSNNYAESALRGPVVGRKNYYGSGSIWSARLTAMMFSIIETLKKWSVNPISWLTNYLETCANYKNGPPWWVVNDLLPWDIPDTGLRNPLAGLNF